MAKKKPAVGTITWTDLTVPNATEVRDFYAAVAGWKSEAIRMDDSDDYVMKLPVGGKAVGGICHARGENKDLPPHWIIYITVADLTASLRACRKLGGKVVRKARSYGGGRFAMVQDPAGAVTALFQMA